MNNKSIKVSVLMSVLGYQKYVSASIESILNQTYTDFNFLIIDDGCDYDLRQIINDFNDSRILYVKNARNIGLTESLLRGIEISKAPYIVRQDAGNISLPGRIRSQLDFLDGNPELYLVGSSVILIDEGGEEICREDAITDEVILKQKIQGFNCIYHSSIMFRNDGRYSYRKKFRYSQDYDLYLRLLSDNIRFTNLPDFLVKERLVKNSITYRSSMQQQYYKHLALKFHAQRTRHLDEGYGGFSDRELPSNANVIRSKKDDYRSFYRQKAYLLLFALKFGQLRKLVKEYAAMYGFDLKLSMYFLFSFLPPVVRALKNKKGIRII